MEPSSANCALKAKKFSVFFVLIGYALLVYWAAYPELPSQKERLCLYTSHLGDDLKRVVLRALEKATRSIYMQAYALTDPAILSLLKQQAAAGLDVTLFYDPSACDDLSSTLRPYGIQAYPVQCSGLMHRKILIIDGQQLFFGSANFTTSSLKMHGNLLLGLYDPALANAIASDQGHQNFFLLPDSKEAALASLLRALDGAKEQILISLFTFTHPLLIDALVAAHQRGIVVNIAMDYYSGKGASALAVQRLREAGIAVRLSRGPQLLHDKWALIDESTLILGSANWTEAAFSANQDCLAILEKIGPKERRSLKKMWKSVAASCDMQGAL